MLLWRAFLQSGVPILKSIPRIKSLPLHFRLNCCLYLLHLRADHSDESGSPANGCLWTNLTLLPQSKHVLELLHVQQVLDRFSSQWTVSVIGNSCLHVLCDYVCFRTETSPSLLEESKLACLRTGRPGCQKSACHVLRKVLRSGHSWVHFHRQDSVQRLASPSAQCACLGASNREELLKENEACSSNLVCNCLSPCSCFKASLHSRLALQCVWHGTSSHNNCDLSWDSPSSNLLPVHAEFQRTKILSPKKMEEAWCLWVQSQDGALWRLGISNRRRARLPNLHG